MKRLTLALLLAVALSLTLVGTVLAATLVEDDFESGTTANFTGTVADPGGSVTVSSTDPIEGTYSLLVTTDASSDDAGLQCFANATPDCGDVDPGPGWSSAVTEIYVKFDWRLASDVSASNLGFAWIESSSGIILGLSTTGTNSLVYWNGGGWTDTGTDLDAGTDYCIEFSANDTTNAIEIRVDEGSVATNSQAIPSIDQVLIGRDFNNGATEMRYDNVVISDSGFPGCGAPPPTPTPTPTPARPDDRAHQHVSGVRNDVFTEGVLAA